MMGDIVTPESVEAGNIEIKNNLGEEYDDKMHSNYLRSFKGSQEQKLISCRYAETFNSSTYSCCL